MDGLTAPELTPAEARVALGPYQGLTFFTEDDAEFFYGRDHWRDVIIANLRARRLTVLYGPSGVGKSSLLRAGVKTRLVELAHRDDVLEFVPVYFSAWQGDPAAGVSEAIRDAASTVAKKELTQSAGLLDSIEDATGQTGVPLLIILDQFEDYWTYQGPAARDPIETTNGDHRTAGFGAQLALAVDSGMNVNFLVSLREDALAQLDRTFKRRVRRLLDHRLSLTPLNREEAELAIRAPLAKYSELIQADPPLDVEDSLVDVVLDQVRVGRVSAGKGALQRRTAAQDESDAIEAPYLQLVMRKIWESEHDKGSHLLRASTLADFGGAEEIVNTHVAAALADVGEDARDAIAELLRYLVSPSNTKIAWTVEDLSRFTKRPTEEIGSLLTTLADPTRRIIRAVGNESAPRYEIFHDVLAHPLLEWASDREQVRVAREKDKRLQAEQRERHERAAKLRAQRLVATLIAAVIAALVTIAVIFIENAKHESHAKQSEQLAARAAQISDVGLASLYALESYRISHTEDARSAILQVAGSHEIGKPFATSDGGINRVAWSPDKTTLATAGGNGWVRLWDVRTHRELAQIPPPVALDALRHVAHLGVIGRNIGAIAFSPHGNLLAYGQNIEYYNAPSGIRTVLATVRVWDLRAHRLLFVLRGPTSRIDAIAFSPDGNQLAVADGMIGSASSENKVRLWNLRGRRTEKVLSGNTGPVNSVAFSPNGKTLASSSCDLGDYDNHSDTQDHSVSLWSTRTGSRLRALRGTAPICGVTFSPNGKTLAAAGDDRSVTLWDLARRQPLEPPFVGHADVLNDVAFSPDGTTLASAGRDHTVRIWDVASHREVGTPLVAAGGVDSVAFNPDGTTLAAAGADGARLWSVAGPYELGVLRTTNGTPALNVAFSPDNRTLAWTDSYLHKSKHGKPVAGTVYLWNIRRRGAPVSIPAPTDNVNSLAFGPAGQMLTWAADDQSVWVWSVLRHSRLQQIHVPNTIGATLIERVAISPDGNTVAFVETVGVKSTIELWNLKLRRLVSLPIGKVGGLGGLAFSPDGKQLASAGFDGTVRLWDPTEHRAPATLQGQRFAGGTTSEFDVAFSPDGKTIAAGGGDGAIRFWDVASRNELGAPLTQHTAAAYSVAFSPDGKTLASASLDDTVRLWDVASKRALLTLAGHTDHVYGAAFSSDGSMVASAGGDGTVRLWGNFSLQSAINRLCTYVNTRAAQRVWQQIEPSIGYRQPCG
jgi:WD40 repeat protein